MEEKGRGGWREDDYLEPLGTVIPPTSVGFDVGFLRGRVEAGVFQGQHAVADIFQLGVGDCRVEFEEDDVDDWHYDKSGMSWFLSWDGGIGCSFVLLCKIYILVELLGSGMSTWLRCSDHARRCPASRVNVSVMTLAFWRGRPDVFRPRGRQS